MATTATDLYLKKLRQKYKEKGATEQEAETMASQDQAQQEAQNIQNGENLNGWQKFGAGVEEFVDGMAQTFLDLGEGLVDSIAIAAGSIAEGVGDTTSAKNIRGWVERDWTDELVNQGNAFGTGVDLWRWANFPSEALWGNEARDYSRQNDLLPDVVDSISSGIGSSLGMGALSSIPYVGWVLTGMAAGGASAEQELRNNPDTDISSAMGYGILNGMTEVASELLVGKVLGWIGKGVNSAMGNSVVSETATRFGLGSSTGGNILTNLLKEFNEEGIEEVVSEFVDPIARKLTIEKDKPIGDALGETWGNAEWWINDVWTAYWQGGLSAVVMGGTGAAVNTVKAGGVKNYNAILQVKQVAEINEQIKELESKNTNGMYDSKIEALTAQKENVINNFQKNFEQFVNDYLKSQTEETLSKKEMRRASIGEEMNYEQNRNVRQELATESAVKAGALKVTFDENGKPSYAISKDNFINYDGKKLTTKEWIKEVIHEIGHLNVKDFNWVDSILQDVDAQELENTKKEYYERYKNAYTASAVRKTDYYKEEFEKTKDVGKAIQEAREKMIKEEIAMDRFASYFNNIDEFKRALSGEKLSLIERLKEKFINTYKNVELAQKPKNYNAIIKTLREAVQETKERRTKLLDGTEKSSIIKDERYRISSSKEDDLTAEELQEIDDFLEDFNKYVDEDDLSQDVDDYLANFKSENLEKIEQTRSENYTDEELKKLNEELPVEVKEYFKDSFVKSNSADWFDGDKNAKYLIPMFHGTQSKDMFYFDSKRIGQRGTVRGYGFYLTSSINTALDYSSNSGKIITAFVNITHPMEINKITVSKEQIRDFITKYIDKTGDGLLGGYGVDAYANYNKAVEAAINNIFNHYYSDADIINEIYTNSGMNYDEFFNLVTEYFGFDGIIYPNLATEGTIVVAFKSNQIKDISNKKPTKESKDIRYRLTDEQWNKVSKQVTEDYKERFGEDIDYQYAYSLVNELDENLARIDKNGKFEELTKSAKGNMALEMLKAYKDTFDELEFELEDITEQLEEAKSNNDKETYTELLLRAKTLEQISSNLSSEAEYYHDEVDREGDYDNYVGQAETYNVNRVEEAGSIKEDMEEISNKFDGLYEEYEEYLDDFKEPTEKKETKVEEKNTEEKMVEETPKQKDCNDTSSLDNKQLNVIKLYRNNYFKQFKATASALGKTDIIKRIDVIDSMFAEPNTLTKGAFNSITDELNEIRKTLLEEQNGLISKESETKEERTQRDDTKSSTGSNVQKVVEQRATDTGRGTKSEKNVSRSRRQIRKEVADTTNRLWGDSKTSVGTEQHSKSKLGTSVADGVGRLDDRRNAAVRIRKSRSIGDYIRRVGFYELQNLGDKSYKTVDIDVLPQFFKDEYNELSKFKDANGNPVKVYYYIDDSIASKNGFSNTNNNVIAIKLDSDSFNTATHELTHHLRSIGSKSYETALTELINYSNMEKYSASYKKLYDKIAEKYAENKQNAYAQSLYEKDYASLNEIEKRDVDSQVNKKVTEELLCAVLQGKELLQDIKYQKDLINYYLYSIKQEYGIDLSPYYASLTTTLDNALNVDEITADEYMPITPIEAKSKAEAKQVMELICKYYEKLDSEIARVNAEYQEKVITAKDVSSANEAREELLKKVGNLSLYRNSILKSISVLNRTYPNEVKANKALNERLNSLNRNNVQNYNALSKRVRTKLIDSVERNATFEEESIKALDKAKKQLLKRIDTAIEEYSIFESSPTYEKLQLQKDKIKTTYENNIDTKTFDFEIQNLFTEQIDNIIAGYSEEQNRANELLKKQQKELEKERKEKLKLRGDTSDKKARRTDYTYSREEEIAQLDKISKGIEKELTEWQQYNHNFNEQVKKQVNRYHNGEIKHDSTKHRLLEKILTHIQTSINYREALNDKLYSLIGNDIFRMNVYNKKIGNAITSLNLKLGTASEGKGFDSWYSLKAQLEFELGVNTELKSAEQLKTEFEAKLNTQTASEKKEIKNSLSEIERKIPNEIQDYIDALEEKVDRVKELEKKLEEDSEEKAELKDLVAKLEKDLAQAEKQLKKAKNEGKQEANYWKRQFVKDEAKIEKLTKTVEDLKQKYIEAKKSTDITESEEYINLKKENASLEKRITSLEKRLNSQLEATAEAKKKIKELKSEYSKKVQEKVKEAKTKKIADLRRKLVIEKVNNKSMIKIDKNFYAFMNELMGNLQQDFNPDKYGDFFDYNVMVRFAQAFAENDYQRFAEILVEELEIKGFDKELLALENGDHLYYEYNFTDLIEKVFMEINDYKTKEFTELGKLLVRLENAKTDYKLLQEAYTTNLRIRTATTNVKAFTKFFNENTKATSSRLNGVDTEFREALVNFVTALQETQSIEDVADGSVRREILKFFKELKKSYKENIEVNGIALDKGITDIVDILQEYENQYEEYLDDLTTTSEAELEKAETEKDVKKATAKDTYKISDDEAQLYRELFKGLKRFTEDVMHNRYWEVGDVRMKGVDFTRQLVNETQEYQKDIKQLKWNPLSKMYISPRNIFREISGYNEKALVMELFNELEKGTIRTMEAKMELALPLKQFFDKHKKFAKELQTDSEKYRHTIKYGSKSITASTTMLIDFYEAIQNENNKQHFLRDGFEMGDTKIKKLTANELELLEQAISKEFDLENKESIYSQYIKLLNNMYELAKKYKIETDIRSRGFTNVDEGFYYPTNVSDFNLDIDLSKSAYNQGNSYGGVDLVTNQRSFNIARTSTRGAVKIVNSYEKMLNHINGMASYYGVDTAILNFSKIYRYRVEGGISGGNAIRQLYGADYKNFDKYLGELFKDMRGTNTPTTGSDEFFKKVESIVRSGVVTATLVNPKVIATQPVSILAAMKYIKPKYILSSLKEGFVLTKKYPPLPTVGAYRYFDQSALQAETGGVNGIQKMIGKGISAGDHVASNILWAASCKQEGLLNYEKGTAEYDEAYRKAERLFTRVENDTQPNNSATGKAEIMRSDNEVVKLLTMYRSQAMQNFNIAYDAINQLRTMKKIAKARHLTYEQRKIMLARPRKELARALASLILEGALFTFIGQLFSHFVNNDWDEEDFWLHATNDFGVAYFNDNILGIMPILNKLELEVEDKVSISMDNITMGWLENVISSLQKMSDGASPKEFIQVISYATGIPIATNYKYTKAIVQYIAPEFAYEFDAIYNGTNTRSKSAINYALKDKQYDKAYELYKKYTSYSMEFDTATTKELFELYKDGYTDVAVKPIPSSISYNEQKYKVDETKFKDIYSKVAKHINNLTKSSSYKRMTKDERASTIKYLLNMYYSLAKKNFTGQDLSFIEKTLSYDMKISVDTILMIKSIKDIEADEKLSKKEKIQLYINKLKTTKAYKYFLYMASGYSLSDEQKKIVKGYLINNGLSWKKATEVLK